ncbi:MAG: hypothetical protein MUC38_09785 [Cyclobacteriaceae bacterium]|jgi:hypothetical protein|nr:hypothetical protein [Cyclobacteriaceae bacterium]
MAQLQAKSDQHRVALQEQLTLSSRWLRPSNLLESFMKVMVAPQVRTTVFRHVAGIGIGYLFKVLLLGRSGGSLRHTVGSFVQYSVASLVSRNGSSSSAIGLKLMRWLLSSRPEKKTGSGRDEYRAENKTTQNGKRENGRGVEHPHDN